MRCAHQRARAVAKQHRQTIGHHDRARHAALRRDACIGHHAIGRGLKLAILRASGQLHHLPAMHLLQIHRLRSQRLRMNLPVARHSLGLIAHMVAQIERVIRRARYPTIAQATSTAHLRGRRPIRLKQNKRGHELKAL